jgi:hypothetical protein
MAKFGSYFAKFGQRYGHGGANEAMVQHLLVLAPGPWLYRLIFSFCASTTWGAMVMVHKILMAGSETTPPGAGAGTMTMMLLLLWCFSGTGAMATLLFFSLFAQAAHKATSSRRSKVTAARDIGHVATGCQISRTMRHVSQ